MKIKFYTPTHEIIPTELRLEITDIDNHPDLKAVYKRREDKFAYDLTIYHAFFWQENTQEVCDMIAEKVASIMCSQSYDHGAQWRVTMLNRWPESNESYNAYTINFRVRDAG